MPSLRQFAPAPLRRAIGRLVRRKAAAMARPAAGSGALGAVIAYNAFGGYCVPASSSHRPAAQAILRGRVWEASTIDFIRARLGAGDLIHAGTYFGDFLPGVASAAAPEARIWAFEPNPESYRCAAITVALNGLENVTLANAGLGLSAGRAQMRMHEAGGRSLGGASRITDDGSATGEVGIVAIDDVVPADRMVSVIHLDVERYEQQALSGALHTIARCRPIIILETLPDPDWLQSHILALGYTLAPERIDENAILIPPLHGEGG